MAKSQKRAESMPKTADPAAKTAKKVAGPKYLRDSMTSAPTATNMTGKGKTPRGGSKA
ncbi:hypothetical protein L1787_11750 [Acuticoccus sp. M5D2P5]|uniref:hypothetical protein n=1 Tax=Acuticoccus kalidii TaxID=2910977 RepID=UPI001F35C934|nr:hypothetical protein [Acuticoccus kalidii]MCF3934093.1 hypothetical protein [Acuticoccus kalidii]